MWETLHFHPLFYLILTLLPGTAGVIISGFQVRKLSLKEIKRLIESYWNGKRMSWDWNQGLLTPTVCSFRCSVVLYFNLTADWSVGHWFLLKNIPVHWKELTWTECSDNGTWFLKIAWFRMHYRLLVNFYFNGHAINDESQQISGGIKCLHCYQVCSLSSVLYIQTNQ